MQREFITLVGARENNLKNVSLQIPKRKITVFTGVSGSGKSSLVFDTIAAEAQRQLNETFTTFIRNRLPKYGHPDIDAIENLSAAVIVSQKRIGGNARSTVGTITDIYSLGARGADSWRQGGGSPRPAHACGLRGAARTLHSHLYPH
jgi:excinuclease UvrABC ATPase subunit